MSLQEQRRILVSITVNLDLGGKTQDNLPAKSLLWMGFTHFFCPAWVAFKSTAYKEQFGWLLSALLPFQRFSGPGGIQQIIDTRNVFFNCSTARAKNSIRPKAAR
jgi:hypothetical protein